MARQTSLALASPRLGEAHRQGLTKATVACFVKVVVSFAAAVRRALLTCLYLLFYKMIEIVSDREGWADMYMLISLARLILCYIS